MTKAVRDIYKNPEVFSSESLWPWDPEPSYRFVPTQVDPPEHIKYRRIVNPWFSPRAIDVAWLRVIPDFRIATDEPLLERGGGSMMTLLSLPLEWEVA